MVTLTQLSDTPSVPTDTARQSPRERIVAGWPELLIVIGALVLFAWGLSKNGYSNPYYAAAERSMTRSWKNFVFGASDPGGWITTDKPPLALWFGALSARVFGYTSWSLLMPSVLAGVASVGLVMATVRRAWGPFAGRVAGVAFALTPVMVAVSRANNPDAMLVLCLVAAAYATQRAISDKRPGWLVVAGCCCGLGFLAKLLVAGLVMPGAFAAYLVAGPLGWRRRLRDVVLAGAAFLLIAGSWIALVDLTPASSRPYVANSTNNTAQNVVFGADGFGRLTGDQSFGLPTSTRGFGGGNLTAVLASQPGLGGTPGIARLFNAGMGDQVTWLVVPAALALLAGVVLAVRRRLSRPEVGSLVLWGGFGIVTYLVFAYTQGVFHNYYVCAFAPAVAALVGISVALARRAGRSGTAWVLVALAGTAILEVILLRRVNAYPALRALVSVGLAVAAALVLAGALRVALLRRHLGMVLAAGLAVALLAPAAWALSGVRHPEDAAYAASGPALKATPRGGVGNVPFGFGGAGIGGAGLAPAELAWLRGQHHHERWLVAVPSSIEAEEPIIAGDSVMPMGGFYGTDPAMTRDRLATLVADNELRFVDTGGFTLGDPNQIDALVAQACTHVNPVVWHGTPPGTLYDCAGRQHSIRTIKVHATPNVGAGTYGDIRLGPPAALQRLLACFRAHGWNPITGSLNLTSPTAKQALRACRALIPAAVPGAPEPSATASPVPQRTETQPPGPDVNAAIALGQ
ncbi:MAG: ArnT family glycosyltransferase [Acidimicrobiia bacterium]